MPDDAPGQPHYPDPTEPDPDDPHRIDPADGVDDPPSSHGLHVVASRVDGWIEVDDYTSDVRSGDHESLMTWLAARLLGGDARPARYRVSVPNDWRNWTPIDDVIVFDQPMGKDGVYIVWAREAVGMTPTPVESDDSADGIDQRRRMLRARHERELRRELEVPARVSKPVFAPSLAGVPEKVERCGRHG